MTDLLQELDALGAAVVRGELAPGLANARALSLVEGHKYAQTTPMVTELYVLSQWSTLSNDLDPIRLQDFGSFLLTVGDWAGPRVRGLTNLVIGMRLANLGDPTIALDYIEECAQSDIQEVQAIGQCFRLILLIALQRLKEAQAELPKALASAKVSDSPRLELLVHFAASDILSLLGNGDDAEQHVRAALVLRDRVDAAPLEESTLPHRMPRIGEIYLRWGQVRNRVNRFHEAIATLRQGRDLALSAGDHRDAAMCLSEIGFTWSALGEGARSQEYLEEAAREALELGDTKLAMRWAPGLVGDKIPTWKLDAMGRLVVAMELMKQSSHAPSQVESIVSEVLADPSLPPALSCVARSLRAQCDSREGRFGQAVAGFKAVRDIADAAKETLQALRAASNLALTLWEADERFMAREEARDTVFRGEGLLAGAQSSEIRQNVVICMAPAYDILIVMAVTETRDGVDEVLELLGSARTRNVAGWLRRLRDEDIESIQTLRREVAGEIASESRMNEHATARHSFVSDISIERFALPTTRRPTGSGKAELDSLRRHLGPGEVAIDLHATEPGVACTLITRTEAKTFFVDWLRSDRLDYGRRFHASCLGEIDRMGALSRRGTGGWRLFESDARAMASQVPLEDCLEEAAAMLLTCVGACVPPQSSKLVVSCSAELSNLPFWQLTACESRPALSRIPSLECLASLATRPALPGSGSFKVGDASSTLEFVARELDALPQFAEVHPTLKDLWRTAPQARCLHFAGHGVFDSSQPYRSGICIAHSEVDPPYVIDEESSTLSRLTIPGIVRSMDLRQCHLVVLSSCSTGIARSHGASEMTSVGTAFLLAGASNVVAAAWPAYDAATVLLMDRFHQHLAIEESPSRALAHARADLARITYQDAVKKLGRVDVVPERAHPFSTPLFCDVFYSHGIG